MNSKITDHFTPKSSKRVRSNSSPEICESSDKRTKTVAMSAVGSMSIQQLKTVFSELLDSKHIATKEDIGELTSKIDALQAENKYIREELEKQKSANKYLEKQIEALMQKSKRNNLMFYGVNINDKQPPSSIISEICDSILRVQNINIVQVKPVGKPNNVNRPLLVELRSFDEVQAILKNTKYLKDTGITVQKDLTISQRLIKKKLLFIRKNLRQKNPQQKVSVWNNFLYINDLRFHWDNERGLRLGEKDGKEGLESLYKCDLSALFNAVDLIENNSEAKGISFGSIPNNEIIESPKLKRASN